MQTQRHHTVVVEDLDSDKKEQQSGTKIAIERDINEKPRPRNLFGDYTENKEDKKKSNKKCVIAVLIVAGAALLIASGLIGYFLWPKHNNLLQKGGPRVLYSEGIRYEFFYVFKVSESLRLKNQSPSGDNQTSNAQIAMNVTVIVEKNDVEDGGNLSMLIGFEPADDTLIDDSPDNEETEDTLMFYKVVFNEKYEIISITGVSEALNEETLRYLLSLLQQLTPHVRNQLELPTTSPRNLKENMSEEERDEILRTNGQVNSRGIELPDQEHEVDSEGRDVYKMTATNDNLIYPSASMQSRPGLAAPRYNSTERAVIDQDGTLVEDEKSVEFIVGQQGNDDSDRNLGEESEDVAVKGQIYQVTRVEGRVMLICRQEVKDKELEETKEILKKKSTKTVNKADIDRMLLYSDDEESTPEADEDEGEVIEEPRNLLSVDQIRNRVNGHYPADFNRLRNNIFVYKKDIVNLKVLGHRIVGGLYAAAGYSYQFDSEKFGGFASVGAGAYVRSKFYTNDWAYFLSGGATARFQGDKVVFEIGQLKNGRFTRRSYAKTLENPWPELQAKIAEVFNKESSLVSKFKELIREVKASSKGLKNLSIPSEFLQFGGQCTDLKIMIEKFLTDDENKHITQCVDLLSAGVRNAIQQLDDLIKDQSLPQKIRDIAQEVKDIAEDLVPIIERVRQIVSVFEGSVKSIFKSLSLPLSKDISHLNGRKRLFKVCWAVWIVKVCVDGYSTQKASSSVALNVLQMNGEAGPKYEAGIDINGYVSAAIVRAGVRVQGTIASAYLANELRQKDSTNLSSNFEVGTKSCLRSTLNVRAIQANILIYYQRRSVRFRCRRWRCSLRISWKEKILTNRPLIKGSSKQYRLINTC